MMEIVKNVREDEAKRAAFNKLAKATFDLNFENWYQLGYWQDKYIPYCMFEGDRAVANVSVNLIDCEVDGALKHFIQLGTVMTDPEYRNRGLIRSLIEEIEKDFSADGYYLYANDSVLDFYPRFGFEKSTEYGYEKEVRLQGEMKLKQLSLEGRDALDAIYACICSSAANARVFMRNADLQMFYLAQFMTENVFYSVSQDAYAVIEFEDDTALIHDIFSKKQTNLEALISELGEGVRKVVLGFTPLNAEGYETFEVREDNTTFFVKGENLKSIEAGKMRFQTLSHA